MSYLKDCRWVEIGGADLVTTNMTCCKCLIRGCRWYRIGKFKWAAKDCIDKEAGVSHTCWLCANCIRRAGVAW